MLSQRSKRWINAEAWVRSYRYDTLVVMVSRLQWSFPSSTNVTFILFVSCARKPSLWHTHHPQNAACRLPHLLPATPPGLHCRKTKVSNLYRQVVMEENVLRTKVKEDALMLQCAAYVSTNVLWPCQWLLYLSDLWFGLHIYRLCYTVHFLVSLILRSLQICTKYFNINSWQPPHSFKLWLQEQWWTFWG